MKKLILVIAFLLFCPTAHATLIDNLDGTITDDDYGINGIEWIADANLSMTNTFGVSGINANGTMTWDVANSWIVGMNTANYLRHSDWRLPTALNQGGSGPDMGYVAGSEMGHLFYDELGGTAGFPISDSVDPDLALFQNLLSQTYWSGTEATDNTGRVWIFQFHRGYSEPDGTYHSYPTLVVRDGDDVPIPESTTIALLGIGLAGLAGAEVRRRRKKKAVDKS